MQLFHKYICGFVFALKFASVKRSAFWPDWMEIPSPMSLKASSSIADINIEQIVGTSTQPCLTPFVMANVSETSPLFLTSTIIPICRLSIMVVNFSGCPYFLSICHSPVLQTVSNAFVKSTKTIYKGRSCSMHFSWSCRRQKIMSTVLRLERKPHCVSGTTSGVMWLESLFSRILANNLPAAEKKEIYLGNYHIQFGLLFCRWRLCWHPSRFVVHGHPPIF